MKRVLPAVAAIAFSFAVISCSKSSDAPAAVGGDITGTYKVESISGTTIVTLVASGIKTSTKSEFRSTNTTGTMVIDDKTWKSQSVGYTMTGTATGYVYENNVLTDSVSFLLDQPVPATTSTTNYTRVTSDSIFVSGSAINVAGSGSNIEGVSTGFKIISNQNGKLSLRGYSKTAKTTTAGGTSLTQTQEATFLISLLKQ